jgi:ATP-dependent RNA helicase RhlE
VNQFSDFDISSMLKKRLAAANFVTPTPVQAGAIPPALEGRDVLATAQTGTGKTLSFLLPIIEKLRAMEQENPQAATQTSTQTATPEQQPTQQQGGRGRAGQGRTGYGRAGQGRTSQGSRMSAGPVKPLSALILLPTRELAMQVEKVYRELMSGDGMRSALVVGGLAEGPQLDSIRRGARLMIATPGRLEDFLDRKLVKLEQVQILVLDECDRMLDMGFKPAIKRIVAKLSPSRQTLCYSATLDTQMREVVRDYLRNPVRIDISTTLKPAENVSLQMFEVTAEKKHELLEHLLGKDEGSFLVFARTKHGADKIAKRLERSGWSATRIHGDRSQSQRSAALKSFAMGGHRILVATDVAARGIDVPHVAHVVNYDMPREAEDFVHRVGRTGRAARSGIASTFAMPEERGDVKKIERKLAISMKRFRVSSNTSVASGMAQA